MVSEQVSFQKSRLMQNKVTQTINILRVDPFQYQKYFLKNNYGSSNWIIHFLKKKENYHMGDGLNFEQCLR